MNPNDSILLTIDVEDWFQVENFKQWIPFSSWSSHELRVEKNTHRLLDLLDSHNGQLTTDNGHGDKPSATFFVLGWLARRLPHLVREIHTRGHEIASHGYYHALCKEETPENLKRDLTDTKELLEDILGAPVFGYRAPSFSIDNETLKIIEDCGYLYDSSFNSFGKHKRYGQVDLSQNGRYGIAVRISDTFYELPISNVKLGDFILPWGGGGYFRLMPFHLFEKGVRSILKKEMAYLFYMHPWEIDPGQPRVRAASSCYKFRHYINLSKGYSKLSTLFRTFNECHFLTCCQYLQRLGRNHLPKTRRSAAPVLCKGAGIPAGRISI